jgi:hypothetical protein
MALSMILCLFSICVIPCPVSGTQVNWPIVLTSWYKILTEHSHKWIGQTYLLLGTRYSPNIQEVNSRIIRWTLPLLNSELVIVKSRHFTHFRPIHIGYSSSACSIQNWFSNYESYSQSVGLLGRVMDPSQGRCLRRTTQSQDERRHPCLEWDSNSRSQCLSGRKRSVP